MNTTHKRCGACGELWPIDLEHFHSDSSREDGHSPYCVFCKCDKASVYYYDNREKVRHSQKQARANNPEEARRYMREYMQQYRQSQKQQTATL